MPHSKRASPPHDRRLKCNFNREGCPWGQPETAEHSAASPQREPTLSCRTPALRPDGAAVFAPKSSRLFGGRRNQRKRFFPHGENFQKLFFTGKAAQKGSPAFRLPEKKIRGPFGRPRSYRRFCGGPAAVQTRIPAACSGNNGVSPGEAGPPGRPDPFFP